jgi:hypothetical protein
MLEVLYIMNKNEIGEIEDVIGRLGDIEDPLAEELGGILFNIIKPHILKDIKKTGDLNHLQVVGDEHL